VGKNGWEPARTQQKGVGGGGVPTRSATEGLGGRHRPGRDGAGRAVMHVMSRGW
jgi:hypothetical protein